MRDADDFRWLLFLCSNSMAGSEDSTLYALTARMQEMSKASEMYKAEMS